MNLVPDKNIVELMIKAGWSIDQKNDKLETPIDILQKKIQFKDQIKEILEYVIKQKDENK